MIRQDKISKMLIVVAMMLSVYLSTFENTTVILFPALLLTFGLIMEFFLEKKREDISENQKDKEWREIGFYTVIALLGIFVTGFGMQHFGMALAFPGFSGLAYGVLMAVAEEQFFRGFITDLFLARIKRPFVAVMLAGVTFTIYHIARYGADTSAMVYVLAGGIILSWVAYRSKRLSPSMIAHIVNNVRAVVGM